jgi:hypothetical protein
MSTVLAAAAVRLRGKPGRPRKPQAVEPVQTAALPRRLLDLEATAVYLGDLSCWTVRDLEAVGVLRRVRIPLPNGRELRKVLFDIEDLAVLVQRWKEPAP